MKINKESEKKEQYTKRLEENLKKLELQREKMQEESQEK